MRGDILVQVGWYLAFLFSTVSHEAAHAWSALRLGDATASRGGQVTLSPLPHIRREPFGTVVMPLLTLLSGNGLIGWASAPFDPVWAQRYPRRAALMALAGPASNLCLVLLAGAGLRAGVAFGWFEVPMRFSSSALAVAAPGAPTLAVTALSLLFSLNLTLGLLNLLPVPPLDGSAVLPLFLPEAWGRRYQELSRSSPQIALVGMVFAWQVFGPLHHRAFVAAVHRLWAPFLDVG